MWNSFSLKSAVVEELTNNKQFYAIVLCVKLRDMKINSRILMSRASSDWNALRLRDSLISLRVERSMLIQLKTRKKSRNNRE